MAADIGTFCKEMVLKILQPYQVEMTVESELPTRYAVYVRKKGMGISGEFGVLRCEWFRFFERYELSFYDLNDYEKKTYVTFGKGTVPVISTIIKAIEESIEAFEGKREAEEHRYEKLLLHG